MKSASASCQPALFLNLEAKTGFYSGFSNRYICSTETAEIHSTASDSCNSSCNWKKTSRLLPGGSNKRYTPAGAHSSDSRATVYEGQAPLLQRRASFSPQRWAGSLSGNALFDRLHKAINSHAECLIPAASMQTLGSQKPVISAWKSTHGYF